MRRTFTTIMRKELYSVLIVFCAIGIGVCQTPKSVMDVESAIHVVKGDYPEKEQLKAYELLSKYALKGDFDARVFLGCEYLTGVRTEKNVDLGMKYLLEGVEGGSIDAMFCLSKYYYRNGQYEAYLKTLETCSQSNGLFCKVELGSFLLDGRSIYFNYFGAKKNLDYQDVNKALQLLKEASEEGSSDANYLLGKQYYLGRNVDVDYIKAKAYFEKCLNDPYFTKFDMVREYLKKMEN